MRHGDDARVFPGGTLSDLLARFGPTAAAAVAWIFLIASVVDYDNPSPWHGVTVAATICITCWAIVQAVVRHYSGPKLKPGQRVIDDATWREAEAAITRAALAGLRERDAQGPHAVRLASS
jgi:hypothetical protein